MILIERIRDFLWHYATTGLQKTQRRARGMKLTEVGTAVVYGVYESPDQFRTFNAFAADLAQKGIKVYRFVYWPSAPKSENGGKPGMTPPPVATDESKRLFVIAPQDLSFDRCPKALYRQRLAQATEPSFHLLLDTSERFHYVDAYMACLLPAQFKVAFAKELPLKQSPYDLTLKPAEGQDLRGRLDLLLHYLDNF